MKSPWVSRRDLDAAVKVYDELIAELQADKAELAERVRYLERERESFRLAALASEDEPITVLGTDHLAAVAEHDRAVAAHDEAVAKHDKVVAAQDAEDISRWENDGGAMWPA